MCVFTDHFVYDGHGVGVREPGMVTHDGLKVDDLQRNEVERKRPKVSDETGTRTVRPLRSLTGGGGSSGVG